MSSHCGFCPLTYKLIGESKREGVVQAMAMVELVDDDLVEKLAPSCRDLLDAYRQPHSHAWTIV